MNHTTPKLNRPLTSPALLLCALSSLVACGAEDFDPKSLFTSYRVIGIQAEPPTFTFTGESALSVVDYHPSDLIEGEERPEVSYSWRLCPFTLGSRVGYECFVDELELEPNDEGLVIVSPLLLVEQASELMALLMDGEGVPPIPGLPPGPPSSLDVYVKLTAEAEGEPPLEVVKKLTLNLSDEAPRNENPRFEGEGLLIEEPSMGLKVGEELTLTAQVKASSAETYTPVPLEGEEASEQREELLISWATTAGKLDGPFSLIEDPSTKLTLPDEAQTVRVFATVRDGRGGLDVRSIDLNVTE